MDNDCSSHGPQCLLFYICNCRVKSLKIFLRLKEMRGLHPKFCGFFSSCIRNGIHYPSPFFSLHSFHFKFGPQILQLYRAGEWDTKDADGRGNPNRCHSMRRQTQLDSIQTLEFVVKIYVVLCDPITQDQKNVRSVSNLLCSCTIKEGFCSRI